MESPASGRDDRRRSPRFSCGGDAKIIGLPSNGLFLPGRVRDLSLGGCCVEMASVLDCGARTEIVLRINSASFRAVSQVRAIRDRVGVGLEFVHLSARGKDLLADVVERLARLQALVNQLRSARRDAEAEVLLRELERKGFHAILLNQYLRVVGAVLPQEPREEAPTAANSEPLIVEAQAEIVPVDLFI
ncbi:MAG: PilZ domain-containing protein [Acidobacteriia bacterium]|nr:PilZ domain-containing protein [Terriglobia bacterium]